MQVYVLTFIAATALAALAGSPDPKKSRRSNRIFAATCTALLVLVSAFRWNVGTDYETYQRLFPVYVREFETNAVSPWNEPGIRFLAWISMMISNDSRWMFGLAAAITIGLSVRTYWKASYSFFLAIAVYILAGGWHGSFNTIRQYIAGAILLAGHKYILERRLLKWILVVLIASIFHISALVGISFYFLPINKTSFGIQAAILFVGIAGALSLEQILGLIQNLDPTADFNASKTVSRAVNPLRILFSFIPIALYWLLKVRDSVKELSASFYVNMMAVYAAITIAGAESAYLARFAIYPLAFLPIAFYPLTNLPDYRERIVTRLLLLFIYATFFYVEIQSSQTLQPFHWIFSK